MQMKMMNGGSVASISVEGRQYAVRDGVVDVLAMHVAAAKSLGFGFPDGEPAIDVGRPLTGDERAELEALRKTAAERTAASAEAPKTPAAADAAKPEAKPAK